MKKMTFAEVCSAFYAHNEGRNLSQFSDPNSLTAVVVFKSSNWPNNNYTEAERSYKFSSDNKYFISGMGGNSIFGYCFDGIDMGVRLDHYVRVWEIDYCYIME